MLKKIFLNDVFLLIIISFNALIIFLQGFFSVSSLTGQILEITDHIFTSLFIIEAIIKIQSFETKRYIKDTWNSLARKTGIPTTKGGIERKLIDVLSLLSMTMVL